MSRAAVSATDRRPRTVMRHVTVRDLMHPEPPTVGRHSTVDDALDVLLQGQVSEVYVVDGGHRLLGVVPDYEILKARLSHADGSNPVETLMTRCCATTHPDVDVSVIATTFRECRYHRLAVVEDGILVGQIGRTDILRMIAGTPPQAESWDEHSLPLDSTVRSGAATNRLLPHEFRARIASEPEARLARETA